MKITITIDDETELPGIEYARDKYNETIEGIDGKEPVLLSTEEYVTFIMSSAFESYAKQKKAADRAERIRLMEEEEA